MKRLVVAAFAGIALLAAGCALMGGGGALVPLKTKDTVVKGKGYQPLEEGRGWIYTGKAGPMGMTMAVKITGAVTSPDGQTLLVAAVKTKAPFSTTNSTVYFTEIDGAVRIIRTDTLIDVKKGYGVDGGEVGILYAPPKTVCKTDMKVGDEWTDNYTQLSNVDISIKTGFTVDKLLAATGLDEYKAQEQKLMTETLKVLGRETVTVPFGTFDCLKVESHPNESQTFYAYYAEGYGKIKEEAYQDGKVVMTLELVDMDSANVDNFFSGMTLMDKINWLKSILSK